MKLVILNVLLAFAIPLSAAIHLECRPCVFVIKQKCCHVTNLTPMPGKHDEVTSVEDSTIKIRPMNLTAVNEIEFYSFMQAEYYPEKVCKYFKDLEVFDGHLESLKYISRGVFEGCAKLNVIKVYKTQLRYVPEGTFADLPELKELNLEENKLKYLPANLIVNNPKLEIFIATRNELRIVDIQFPSSVKKATLWWNVCIDYSDPDDIASINQLLAKNCSSTAPQNIDDLLAIEVMDTSTRCTETFFRDMMQSNHLIENKLQDIVVGINSWEEAEILLQRDF